MRLGLGRALLALAVTMSVAACGSDAGSTSPPDTAVETPVAPSTTTTVTIPTTAVLVDFADPGSIDGWRSVDDSVMGGISRSTTSWSDGRLLFEGLMTTENNGGFTSTIGPADRALGAAATGAVALGVDAIGDGRTYVLQVRAGPAGGELWIARFTPATSGVGDAATVSVPVSSFSPVDRFLRPRVASGPLDPATIVQIAIYLIDGQVGQFRLAVRAITAERQAGPRS